MTGDALTAHITAEGRQPGAEELNVDKFGLLLTTLWFLQDQTSGFSATERCILYQFSPWMGVATGWVFWRVKLTHFVVT